LDGQLLYNLLKEKGKQMKYLVWIVILAIVAFFIYSIFFRPQSEEEAQVKQLEKVFRSAEEQYVAAVRQMVEPGMATIADPEPAIKKIKEVQTRLATLQKNLKQPAAIALARRLEERIEEFCSKNDID
jgi:delta-aminolevulinic acid dehydratase/porphobilinogen synthase